MQYRVSVYTGKVEKAGTNAHVYLNVVGANGQSADRLLDNADDNHACGKVDQYVIDARDLGELQFLHIRHDNSGSQPGWFLDKIEIQNMHSGETWQGVCGEWLALTAPPFSISRTLKVRRIE